jgi:hypothetical protein
MPPARARRLQLFFPPPSGRSSGVQGSLPAIGSRIRVGQSPTCWCKPTAFGCAAAERTGLIASRNLPSGESRSVSFLAATTRGARRRWRKSLATRRRPRKRIGLDGSSRNRKWVHRSSVHPHLRNRPASGGVALAPRPPGLPLSPRGEEVPTLGAGPLTIGYTASGGCRVTTKCRNRTLSLSGGTVFGWTATR